MSTKHTLPYLLAGFLCIQAHAASPVLINGNFDDLDMQTAPYNAAYDAVTNPNGYQAWYSAPYAGDPIRDYLTSTPGIGWQTDQTGTNDVIELWDTGAAGFASFSGNQYAELNSRTVTALYQDVTIGLAGDVDYGFAHINRDNGTDVMKVVITYLGIDGVIGGGDDVVKIDQQYSATNLAGNPRVWNDNVVDNAFTSVAGGTYRFSFGAVSQAGGDATQGNFLDKVRFGINAVPEPSSALLGAFGALALLRRRRN
jgi:hypothetical protein